MIKRALLVATMILAAAFAGFSQFGSGNWNLYSVFDTNQTRIIETSRYVYFLSDNSLFRHDKATSVTIDINKRNGVNDTFVKDIYYDCLHDNVVVVYTTSNIDIIASDGKVTNLPGIADIQLTSTRVVNDVTFSGNLMYVATDFGYLTYDLQKHSTVELNMYYTTVNSVLQVGNYVVLCTPTGIYKASIGDNHGSIDNFSQLSADLQVKKTVPGNGDSFFIVIDSQVIYATIGDGTISTDTLFNTENVMVCPSDNSVVITGPKANFIMIADYDGVGKFIQVESGEIYSNISADGSIWKLSASGISHAKVEDNTIKVLSDAERPNAITMTRVGNLIYNKKLDKLYVMTCGANDIDNKYGYLGHINTLQNGIITDVTPASFPTANSASVQNRLQDVYSPIFDPNDPETYYIGTWYEGFYRIKGNEVTGKFDWTNSLLALKWYCITNGISFDSHNNLWVIGRMENGIGIMMLPADKLYKENITADDWVALNMQLPSTSNYRSTLLVSSKCDFKITYTGGYGSILSVIDDGGNPAGDNVKMVKFTSFVDQYGVKFAPHRHYGMYEDSKGMVWLLSSEGAVRFDPSKAFDTDFHVMRYKTGDGNYLLDGIGVSSMSEDADGNFWFGTITMGMVEVDADCTKIINNYTASNSLLPDDKVLAVCCKPQGGAVYIGTCYGLTELNPGVTPGERDYSKVTVTPCNVAKDYTGYVLIEKLIAGSTVTVVDSKGATVAEIAANGGKALWNITDESGKRVPIGRYSVKAASGAGMESVVVGYINVLR